ncbi:unnamed protein product [Peronospora belbahrii]|uniref:Uncharacterized protein n=1 Tax=Peronospora belbahrii TaxID=622444 RepID=A0ABN8CS03_9STRA|nr:unnamed protein product [Peronospora belbahrii]
MNTLNDTEAKRQSRINNTRLVDEQDGTILEDRAMTLQTTVKTLFKSALTKLQKFFRSIQRRFSVDAMQKQTDNMFKGYRVDQAVVPNILHSYSYKAWADEVRRIYHGNNEKTDIAIISLLTFRYGDAQLRRMLMEVGDVPWKKQIDRLKNAQIDY